MRKYLLIISLTALAFVVKSQEKLPVSSIEIEGNKVTKKEIIIRELSFQKGDSLSINELIIKIKQSEKNLKNMKLFNFSQINFVIQDNKQFKIKINLIEQWYIFPYPIIEVSERNFNVWWDDFKESNYSDFSKINYGIYLNWKNFRGKNESLKLKFRRGFKEQYLTEYGIPYVNKEKTFGIKTKISLLREKRTAYETNYNQLEYYEDNSYSKTNIEASLFFNYKPKIQNTHSIGFSYFRTAVPDSVIIKNPYYFTNKNNSTNKIGDYCQLHYIYHYENRDYSEYPLNGNSINFEAKKNLPINSSVQHIEVIAKLEHYLEPIDDFFLGTSFQTKWSSSEYQPYFSQKGFGFDNFVRGYEYYVIDGQKYWLSKTAIRYPIIDKKTFEIPYIKLNQFRKAHIAVFISLFSDLGYIIDRQKNQEKNPLSNMLLWGKGISIDFITYYDRILRIEYSMREDSINQEKGIFLHFSSPF